MGIDADLGLAYAKAQMAAPPPLPKAGNIFISVKDADKDARRAAGARLHRTRVRDHRDQRHGHDVGERRHRRDARLQASRRTPARARP